MHSSRVARAPPSFPTRRSSDLEAAQLQAFAALARDASAVVTYNGGSFDLPLLRNRFALQGLDDPLYGVPHLDLLPLDRKSTRLNSSHVAISYAVFCLKKKKRVL